MNSKKSKNKNRPKPNPSPPQKNEPVPEKVEEVTSGNKPECIQSVEERVPEIISETIPPVAENIAKDEDSPKKPKRNRGKKKKSESDERDSQENPTQGKEEIKIDTLESIIVETIETIPDEPSLTPSARKKKNKNKKGSESEQKHTEKTEELITEPIIEEKETEELSVTIPQSENPSDLEAKQKKKNKKKKNQTDSEKSEKSDDIICTTAFQQLIKDDKGATQRKTSENSAKADAVAKQSVVEIPPVEIKDEKPLDPTKKDIESKQAADDKGNKNTSEAGSKGKNKNKKDKKNPPKDDVLLGMGLSQEAEIILIDDFAIVTPTPKDEHIEPIEKTTVEERPQKQNWLPEELNLETIILTEEVGTSSPTVAKPVERKRKGKGQDPNKELKSVVEIPPVEIKEEKSLELMKEHVELSQKSVDDIANKNVVEAGNKNKKKNKKDEKHPPKNDVLLGLGKHTDLSQEAEVILIDDYAIETPTPKTEVKLPTTVEEQSQKKELAPELFNCETIILTEEVGTSRPIIEKPVERKRKGKGQDQNKEQKSVVEIPPAEIKEGTSLEPVKEHVDLSQQSADNKGNKNTSEAGNKNKKKNKKDEKHPPKDDVLLGMDMCTDLSREAEIILIDDYAVERPTPKIDEKLSTAVEEQSQNKELIPGLLNLETVILTEEVGTLSAETVERKHKGKGQDKKKEPALKYTTEQKKTQSEEISPKPLISQDKPIKELKAEEKDNVQSKPVAVKLTEILTDVEKPPSKSEENVTDDMKLVANIPPPSCEMGKKRKKSPKVMKSEIAAKLETGSHITKLDQPTKVDETDKIVPVVVSVKEELKQEELEKDKPETKLDKPVKSETSTEPKQKDNKLDEHKGKNKRKKSPKLPVESDIDKEIEEQSLPKTHETIQVARDDKSIASSAQKELKTSSPKTPEATPDIQHPRATSHEPTDGNNNMTIQEIIFMDEFNMQMPVDVSEMPLIQGSGETPTETPGFVIIGNVTDTETKIEKPITQEKTDLKSKMIEVNQDMEELRLSIERSLAELTSIEKGEQEVEKELASKVLHITEESDKPRMPSELIAKPSAEKGTDEVTTDKSKHIETSQSCEKSAAIKPECTAQPMKILTENIPFAIPLSESSMPLEYIMYTPDPPVCPSRKENKNKGKNKKKGKHEVADAAAASTGSVSTTPVSSTDTSEAVKEEKGKKEDSKPTQKTEKTHEKGKQQTDSVTDDNNIKTEQDSSQMIEDFEPIESFEDAMTSSADDINKTFEMIANESNRTIEASHVNPEISITVPTEDSKQVKRDDKVNPVSQPKNLLGHPNIPVPSNRIDYKKEKNKSPNETLAKVKIKDAIEVEAKRESKESQTENIRKFMKNKSIDESFSLTTNENEDFIYKYSFRKVFLQSACHVCKKDLKQARVPCNYCSIVFYCNNKHKDDDWPQHQALCFAVSTIAHLKDQKHVYADSKDISGQNYRLLRMQMIVSCEKVLKRRLAPWEQEALLYPRVCADVGCREWRQNKLVDCDGCGQISYCAEHPDHYPKIHQRWCKSYSLYRKLVGYQQTRGRLEPKMPGKVMTDYRIPDKMNEVLASMYEEKIDMNDMQYAALTQIATAPLTAAYCYQTYNDCAIHTNGIHKKLSCTVHVVGAQLQYEADALNKWEVFFLHLLPRVQELLVVLISSELNPSNLPLELLSRVKLCENCQVNNRKVVFNFQDRKTYHEYCSSEEYIQPNLVCAFNASISRSTLYTKDPWPQTINSILKQRVPFLITSYTINEIHRDLSRIRECAEYKYNVIIQPKNNNFASVRPDRNFISDDEMPLLFKNYCCLLICGVC